ncbi:anti-sigma factor [Algoriphagus namhaensis]
MDIQAYITSGKLELYLLGELSDRERAEVESMAAKYPEIRQELEDLEKVMFEIDHQLGKTPSQATKTKIFESLENELDSKPVEVISPTKTFTLSAWKTLAIAASVSAILASTLALFFAVRYFEKEREFTALLEDQSVLAEDLNQVKLEYQQKDSQLEKLTAGNFQLVKLKGESLEMQKDAEVNLFWDQNAAEVLVAVNNLNALDQEFDYQLWAIGDEGPVGIGLVNAGERFSLQQMQSVAQAGAFAITIEPKGGSESPTLEKLVVIGNVA